MDRRKPKGINTVVLDRSPPMRPTLCAALVTFVVGCQGSVGTGQVGMLGGPLGVPDAAAPMAPDDSSGASSENTTGTMAGGPAGGSDGAPLEDGGISMMQAQPLSGAELYQVLCSTCHGTEAEGTELAPELRHPPREYFGWVTRNGRTDTAFMQPMAAYDEALVSPEQLDEMLAWLDSFPQPVDAAGLYLDYCENCHGDRGSGGAVDKDIEGKEFGDVHEKTREGTGGDDYGNRSRYMPALSPERITDDELRSITEHIAE